ncbi:MAG: DUF167 domain-containing protein [Gaiellaceae bacterium]
MSGPSIRLRLRVSPGASRSEIVGRYGDAWKVRVAAPPEGGKANEVLVELLATTLDVPRARIEIASGHGSRDKSVLIHGLSDADVEARLAITAGVG